MRLVIDDTQIDTKPEDLPAFTYAIQDPFDLAAIRGSSATPFKARMTNGAKTLFGGVAMAEVTGAEKTMRIMDAGTVYAESKIRPLEHSRDTVTLIAVGNNARWFNDLKNISVRSLKLGTSGIIDDAYIEASWTDEDQVDYYPLIDYGYLWELAVDTGTDKIRPAIRAHRALKSAFNQLGYDLRISGRLNRIWKKFVLPNTSKIQISNSFLKDNRLELDQNHTEYLFGLPNNGPNTSLPVVPDVTTDPGGNSSSIFYYTAPYAMRVRLDIRFTGMVTAGSGLTVAQVKIVNGSNIQIGSGRTITMPLGVVTSTDISIGEIDLAIGDVVGLAWNFQSAVPVSVELYSCEVEVTPINIEYQLGLSVDIAASGPDLSCFDLLKTIIGNRCLVVNTNDSTRVVELSYYDDYFKKHELSGIDMRGREDHTDAPEKKRTLLPTSIAFKWLDDSNDVMLKAENERVGERGWGGYIHEPVGGVSKAVKVELPMCATAMYTYPGSILIPSIRDHLIGVNDFPRYEWKPRLLMADGVGRGEWTLNSVAKTFYPKCFFVFTEENEVSMSFSPEPAFGETGPGTIGQNWTNRLLRHDRGLLLEIDLTLYDNELIGMDYGAPRFINDGHESGWYYFSQIKQKRYGIDEPTRCEMLPE